jgi:hypothetical protein
MDRLTSYVDEGLSTGTLRETLEGFVKWEAVDPKSTDTGPEITQSSRKSVVRMTWTRALLQVATAAHTWPEYAASDKAIPIQVGWMRSVTDWFMLKGADALLRDATRPSPQVARLLSQAIALIDGEPVKSSATVDLGGVRVASPGLEVNVGTTKITLRRPELTDLQPELTEHAAMLEGRELRHYTVSAIAKLEMDWISPTKSGEEVERLQSLLRLFAVASVRYVRVLEEVISPLHEDMGTLTTGSEEHSYERATIGPNDAVRLQALASAIWKHLPIGPIGQNEAEPSPVTTAFRRYSDALTRDGALLERRFASAVMGLESLYLPTKQDGELSFRLRASAGRVSEELGFDGRAVGAEVAFCYGVRSAYVHGGHLSGKLRKSGERRFGDLQQLLRRILDYLRVSIIIALVLEMTKDDFLRVVNDSIVSSKASAELVSTQVSGAPDVTPNPG